MEKFRNRIVEQRKAKGLTQKEMAEKLNIAQVNYSKIETGQTQLTVERLVSIARILEVDLITLLFPDFGEAKYFQTLKDENFRLKKLNNSLISQIERDSATLELIVQFHHETEPLISSLKHIKEGRLLEILNEIKKLN